MGEAESYASRITQLQTEVDSLNTRLSGSLVQYTSPEIGYFARITDGYEAVLTPNSINTMTVEQLRTFSREKVVFETPIWEKLSPITTGITPQYSRQRMQENLSSEIQCISISICTISRRSHLQ